MKRILIQAGNDPFSVPTTESTLVRNSIRGNVGNLMYTNAAYKHLLAPGVNEITVDTTHFAELTVADAARINDECDVFVIPMANAFKKKFVRHLGILADVVNRLKVPVVVFGVGAQATLEYDTEFLAPVNAAVKRFIGAVLDHSASIGVRGEFTKDYLGELGFKDVDVIGCPSVYFRGPDFQMENPAGRQLPSDARIALSTALRLANAEHASAINAAILKQHPDLTYFAQEGRDLQTLYWGDTSVAAQRYTPMPDLSSHPLMRSADVCVPLEPHSWIDSLAEFDFALGTRIHGNIAALVAGTPAFVFAHDSRTLELSRYHHIPHRVLTDIPADVDVASLYAESDYSAFNKNYAEGFQRLLDFMSKNGLKNTYEHGDGGAEYDRRIAATEFTEPYRRSEDFDQADLLFRMTMLKEQNKAAADAAARAEKKAAAQAGRIKKLEAQIVEQENRLSAIETQMKDGNAGRSRGIMKRLSSK
ncbi:polysaccharide pyruvyl transferase family protein [Streptomyces sp. B93]|uniref:polysaccharide pyruvyl transferase family protein n=1 Tax=Streptomyces sp. B93 TaxID=2824875 RepID=UPI001B35D175|nr:polysaccharide pyruvyl transferase family protein [Streptomyces sp. B93]MBQ1088199.1 polysaccharide pyruvyl transferase family protein [Streptomyces sp. B93]